MSKFSECFFPVSLVLNIRQTNSRPLTFRVHAIGPQLTYACPTLCIWSQRFPGLPKKTDACAIRRNIFLNTCPGGEDISS
ncbi:hypothetical protein SISNIDRAFT_459195 [Sistotremastrum niveocremeum HHB9708]|uniref:Uncharacterized protein n=1 Tax=Sistotremastrum niveocremeum HHB9708 TaxID=1314777 RepID=A0A164PRY8_9AGAM|nr:hypothetical protein SISNIDRAFT_459195 [Sistotremastrum niveocremeum HHB9708]